jgi:hypothetical protein
LQLNLDSVPEKRLSKLQRSFEEVHQVFHEKLKQTESLFTVHSSLVTIADMPEHARKRMSVVTGIAIPIVFVVEFMIAVTDVSATSRTNAKNLTIRLMYAIIVRIVEIVLKTDICTPRN